MDIELSRSEILAVEHSITADDTRESVLSRLRKVLNLADFGLLMISMPNPSFPKMSQLLPEMAEDKVQKTWTGFSGRRLLETSLDFTRITAIQYQRITNRKIDGKHILDFGCGYGRLSRMMYYYTPEDNLFAVDPMKRSMELCSEAGLSKNFFLSDYVPDNLPVGDHKFDLIFAFSVFTHLSERATLTCLKTMSDYLAPGGVIAITIRPKEFWAYLSSQDEANTTNNISQQMLALHNETGFAFLPNNIETIEGEKTYGDTSMTVEWLEEKAPFIKVVETDRALNDQFQFYLYLQKNE